MNRLFSEKYSSIERKASPHAPNMIEKNENDEKHEKMEFICRINAAIFPFLFIILEIVYWSVYTNLSETVDDLVYLDHD